MRAVVQRVSSASVSVDGQLVGRCGPGMLLLVGVHKADSEANAVRLAEKIATLRIFNDAEEKMNLAFADLPHSDESRILAISQFTVFGDASKSRRPSFVESAPFEVGKALFDQFVVELRAKGLTVETGRFGEHMEVSLVNDGPVTLILDV